MEEERQSRQSNHSRHSGSRRSQHNSPSHHSPSHNEEINAQDWKEYLSPTSAGCIPFVSMLAFEKVFVLVYAALEVLSLAYKYNRLVYPFYAVSAFVLTQPPSSSRSAPSCSRSRCGSTSPARVCRTRTPNC